MTPVSTLAGYAEEPSFGRLATHPYRVSTGLRPALARQGYGCATDVNEAVQSKR